MNVMIAKAMALTAMQVNTTQYLHEGDISGRTDEQKECTASSVLWVSH